MNNRRRGRANRLTDQQKRRIFILAAAPFVCGMILAGGLLLLSHRLFDEAAYYNTEGLSAAQDGDYELAVQQFSLAITANPQPEYYYNRGMAYTFQENYDLAVVDFTEALRLNDGYGDVYYNRGIALHQTGDYAAAIADFNTLLELEPAFAESLYRRGMVYEAMGNVAAALADYEDYLTSIEPDYAEDARQRIEALKGGQP
jgi:tetratricopeptide (TPR) repeat protein